MGVRIWNDKGRLYLSVSQNGKRRRESLGLVLTGDKRLDSEKMKLAESIRSKREMTLAAQAQGVLDPSMERIRLLEYAKILDVRRNGRGNLRKMIMILERWGENPYMRGLTRAWFSELTDRMEAESLAGSTKETYLATLRKLFKDAVRDGVILSDPSDGVRKIKFKEATKNALTADEIGILARTPLGGGLGAEVKRAFLFCCLTGLRVSDAVKLKWSDFDEQRKQIAVTMTKTGGAVYLPINDEAIRLMGKRDGEFVFPLLCKTKTRTWSYLDKWEKDSGLGKHISWHVARYTYANLLLETGADIYTVQKLLGHTKVSTTEIYAKVSDRKNREAVARLPDIGI